MYILDAFKLFINVRVEEMGEKHNIHITGKPSKTWIGVTHRESPKPSNRSPIISNNCLHPPFDFLNLKTIFGTSSQKTQQHVSHGLALTHPQSKSRNHEIPLSLVRWGRNTCLTYYGICSADFRHSSLRSMAMASVALFGSPPTMTAESASTPSGPTARSHYI